MNLLLLEDDQTFGSGLRDFLSLEGHTVDWATRLMDVARFFKNGHDVLLVDWQLPDGSGLAWVKSLRDTGDQTPVLMMTARDQLQDRIQGLDTGVDDYLVKPFRPEELLARIRAVQRRVKVAHDATVTIGGLEINFSAKTVSVGASPATLTDHEWRVVEVLARRPGVFVPTAELDRLIAGSERDLRSNALEVHIHNLRRKLGRSYIETMRGRGYRLNAQAVQPPAPDVARDAQGEGIKA